MKVDWTYQKKNGVEIDFIALAIEREISTTGVLQ